jgi:hypothetical protein
MSEFKIKLVIWSASESDCIFSMEKKKNTIVIKAFSCSKKKNYDCEFKIKNELLKELTKVFMR